MKKAFLLLLLFFSYLSATTILSEKGNNVLYFQAGKANSYYNIRSYEFEGAYATKFGLQFGLGYQYAHEDLWTSEFVEESWYSRYYANMALMLLDHNRGKIPLDIWLSTQYYCDDFHMDSFSKIENGLIYGFALKRNLRIFNHFEIIPQLSAEHLLFKKIGVGVEDGLGEEFMLTPEVSIRYRFLYAYAKYLLPIPFLGLSNYYFNNSHLHLGVGLVLN